MNNTAEKQLIDITGKHITLKNVSSRIGNDGHTLHCDLYINKTKCLTFSDDGYGADGAHYVNIIDEKRKTVEQFVADHNLFEITKEIDAQLFGITATQERASIESVMSSVIEEAYKLHLTKKITDVKCKRQFIYGTTDRHNCIGWKGLTLAQVKEKWGVVLLQNAYDEIMLELEAEKPSSQTASILFNKKEQLVELGIKIKE